jgi:hypothetical protein
MKSPQKNLMLILAKPMKVPYRILMFVRHEIFFLEKFYSYRTASIQRVIDEEIEIAYSALYGYNQEVYLLFAETVKRMKQEDDNIWSRFMEDSQGAVLKWEGHEADYEGTLLGNQLREVSTKYEELLRRKLDLIIQPMHEFLREMMQQTDAAMIKGTRPIHAQVRGR